MDVGAFRDGFEWHRLLRDVGWVENRARRRRDMGHQPLRLRASAGFFASWTWARSATDPNGIVRGVKSAGGDSPAGPRFMPIRYKGVLAHSLPQPTRL